VISADRSSRPNLAASKLSIDHAAIGQQQALANDGYGIGCQQDCRAAFSDCVAEFSKHWRLNPASGLL
jgi:hypothetical protein